MELATCCPSTGAPPAAPLVRGWGSRLEPQFVSKLKLLRSSVISAIEDRLVGILDEFEEDAVVEDATVRVLVGGR
jgi:hypothetical protein